MANIHGTSGNFAATDFIAKIKEWTANISSGLQDVTGFGDAGFTTAEASTFSLTGSASGILTDTVPYPAADATWVQGDFEIAALVLTVAAGKTFTFPAVISNVEIVRREVGESTVVFDFVNNGRVTTAWA